MTAETLLIVLIRVLVPFTILRWPLAGGLLALVADALDIVLASLIDLGGLWQYHELDKYLDAYYLAFEWAAAQRWEELGRRAATVLFAYRVIGVFLFELTGTRVFLFYFPNLFEYYFLVQAAARQFLPGYQLTPRGLLVILAVLVPPKMVQEYFLHYQRALDDVVAVEVIEDVYRAILDWLRGLFGALRVMPSVRGRFYG
jgi:hypothetical protein